MSDRPDMRRRKLDDLFADEPYLSPTMKARRLHEKMRELSEGTENGGASAEAYVVSRPGGAAQPEPVLPPAAPGGRTWTLREAAEILRQRHGRADVDTTLRRLRDDVLPLWRKAISRRETA